MVKGPWKLIDNNGTLELYNYREDPGELTNLVRQQPAKVQELRTLLDARRAAGEVSAF